MNKFCILCKNRYTKNYLLEYKKGIYFCRNCFENLLYFNLNKICMKGKK